MPKTKSASKSKDFLKSFEFHGLTFEKKGDQAVGDCPLCAKEGHFYVNAETGQWDCKLCSEKGNLYTFLSKLHQTILEDTKPATIKALSKHRHGIPPVAFKEYNIACDGHRYYLPVQNGDGKLANLKVWDGPGTPLIGTTGCANHALNLHLISSNPKATIYIVEGEWDCIALDWLRKKAKKQAVVIGLPGASTLKEDWLPLFQGRDVVFCFDHDKPGQEAQSKHIDSLRKIATHLRYLQWPKGTPNGYDINDFVGERNANPTEAWKELQSLLVEPKAISKEEVNKLGKVDFQRILKEYKRFFYVDNRMQDSLAVCLATAISVRLPHDPLWVFLVGPAGAGKTLMLSSFRHTDRCEYLASISAKSLVSGWKTDDGSDPSLLPKLAGRTLILKDYTEIMSMPQSSQEEIYGTLRNAYDGEYKKIFGHLTRDIPNCYFSLVAGVTHAIKGDNRAALGERFLRFGLLDNTHNTRLHINRSLSTYLDSKPDKSVKRQTTIKDEALIEQLTTAFIDQEITHRPTINQTFQDKLIVLSDLCAALRTRVEKSNSKDPKYRPEKEVGSRLVKQLAKLAQSLCIVLGRKSMDEDVYRIVKIAALDTVGGWHLDVMRPMVEQYPKVLTGEDIALDMNMGVSHTKTNLIDLIMLGMIERHVLPSDSAGRPRYAYRLTKEVQHAWTYSGLADTLKHYAKPKKGDILCPTQPKSTNSYKSWTPAEANSPRSTKKRKTRLARKT